MSRRTPSGRPLSRPARAWVSCALKTSVLLALGLTGCRQPTELVVLNSTDQVVTAVFTPDGTDLLEGAQLPPRTFTALTALPTDTGRLPQLEAYTTTGACAIHPAAPGRWELRAHDLDPSGC